MAPSTIEGPYYTSDNDTAEQVVLTTKGLEGRKDNYMPLLVKVDEMPPLDSEQASPDSTRQTSPVESRNQDSTSTTIHDETITPTIVDVESPSVVQKAGPTSTSPSVQAPAIPLNTVPGTKLPASTRLQKMIHETDKLIVCPGVYDGLSARTAMEVGFDGLYMTGAGTSASRLGMADLGLATLADMRAHAEMICSLKPQGPPVIADIDTGYGGAMMVYRSVCEYIRAGVAGFHLEDQLLEKRCGHLKGKAVVEREEWYTRLRAAQKAKQDMGSDIVLIARTDALQSRGYEECIERLKVARDLGCDVGLLEGFANKEQAQQCVKDLAGWPLLLNSVENGHSPLITVDEAREMGFRIMIFSFASIAPAYQAIRATFQKLKTEGILGTKGEITPRKIFEVCGLEDLVEIDMASGGSSFKAGV